MPIVAAAVVIFGLQLGDPLQLPDCAHESPPFERSYSVKQSVTCQENYTDPSPNPWANTFIIWPTETTPEIASSSTFGAWKRDGRLIGIEFNTAGVETQTLVLQRLTDKFGKPSSINYEPVQTPTGVKVTSVRATWSNTDVYVSFDSAPDRIDRGRVQIMSPEAKALTAAADAAAAAQRTKL